MNENNDIREPLKACDNIESLTIMGSPETTGVTSFVQEACTAVSAIDAKFSDTMIPLQTNMQDVRTYFARPVCVTAGTVATGVRQAINGGIPKFSDIISYWTTGQQRLLGAFGIRATVVYTLQVAATPFHQGLLCLSFQYGYNSAAPFYSRATDPCTSTNLPHVVLDLSTNSMVQLRLPYLYVAEYSDIRGSGPDTAYGQWAISTLTNVPSIAGMGPPTYQMFCHLEDIKLFGVTPQATSSVVLNAGRKLSPVTEEFENEAYPFSSALSLAGRAIGFVGKGIPSLSTLAGPTSWALGKAASLARYFGYGKPQVIDPLMRVVRQDNVGEFNTDVATCTMVMAATASNVTATHTGVGATDVDEMSLKYITSRWSQINVFDISSNTTSGTLIYATPISPLSWWFRAPGLLPSTNKHPPFFSTVTSNSIQPSHLMFAASSFKQWRGGVKFRFTFVKTKMHAGRVMVAFNPLTFSQSLNNYMGTVTNAILPAYGSTGPDPFAYSAIFDLKDSNVFEFEVPYVSPISYANVSATVGFLALYIVNPIIASSVVSPIISCVVEVAGMPDFELANPVGVMYPVHNRGTISTQSGRVLSEAPEVINQHTMGEVITSVKQLISIPHVLPLAPALGAPLVATIPPWYYQPTPSALVPATASTPPAGSFSYGGNWASCYTFLKGGTDLHLYDTSQASSYYLSQCPQTGGILGTTSTPDNRGNSNAPVLFTTENNLHARLPGFFPTLRVFSWIANLLTAAGATWPGSNPYVAGSSTSPYDSIQAIWFLRIQPDGGSNGSQFSWCDTNASDDAQLAMYVGPPPIYLPPAGAVAGPWDVDSRSLLSST